MTLNLAGPDLDGEMRVGVWQAPALAPLTFQTDVQPFVAAWLEVSFDSPEPRNENQSDSEGLSGAFLSLGT